jgi:hypothetical protein
MTRARRTLCSISTLVTILAGAALACTTDQPKSAAVVDAGLGAVSEPAPALAQPEAPADEVADAGSADGAADAGAPDAGAEQAALVAPADAGRVGPAVAGGGGSRPGTAESPPAGGGAHGAFDRVLAKPRDPGADAEALKALVEKKTGQKVALTRRTAGRWLLFQFAPKPGGRSAEDQQKIVAAMKEIDAFSSVEADRLMQVKRP